MAVLFATCVSQDLILPVVNFYVPSVSLVPMPTYLILRLALNVPSAAFPHFPAPLIVLPVLLVLILLRLVNRSVRIAELVSTMI